MDKGSQGEKAEYRFRPACPGIRPARQLAMLRKQAEEQEKEIRRLKEENEFPEEASAFFAASCRKPAKGRE